MVNVCYDFGPVYALARPALPCPAPPHPRNSCKTSSSSSSCSRRLQKTHPGSSPGVKDTLHVTKEVGHVYCATRRQVLGNDRSMGTLVSGGKWRPKEGARRGNPRKRPLETRRADIQLQRRSSVCFLCSRRKDGRDRK